MVIAITENKQKSVTAICDLSHILATTISDLSHTLAIARLSFENLQH